MKGEITLSFPTFDQFFSWMLNKIWMLVWEKPYMLLWSSPLYLTLYVCGWTPSSPVFCKIWVSFFFLNSRSRCNLTFWQFIPRGGYKILLEIHLEWSMTFHVEKVLTMYISAFHPTPSTPIHISIYKSGLWC